MPLKFTLPIEPQRLFEVQEPHAHHTTHPVPEVVDLDLAKIDSVLALAPFGYVGDGGSEQKPEKHNRVRQLISSGDEIEMPIMSAVQSSTPAEFRKSVRVRDGRHRLWNLHQMGYKRVSVVVPKFQAALFIQFFG